MKLRICVFAIVWAFVANALWVPGGLDRSYILSVFFPAWHLFLLGMVIGSLHELLVARLQRRLWVSLATIIPLAQLTLAMFGGNLVGLWLALPVAAATVLASIVASYIPRKKHWSIVALWCLLIGVSVCSLLPFPFGHSSVITDTISPNGALVAQVVEGFSFAEAHPKPEIFIGPRFGPFNWFGMYVGKGYSAHWEDNNNLTVAVKGDSTPYRRYLNIQARESLERF